MGLTLADKKFMVNKNCKFYEDINLILISLVIFTLPFSLHINTSLIIVLVISWLFQGNFSEKLRLIKGSRYFYVFISLYLLHIFGILYSEDIKEAFFQLEKKLALIILPLVIITISLSLKRINILMLVQVVSIIFTCLISLFFSFKEIFNFQDDLNNAHFREVFTHAIGIHHVYLSIYICLSILFSIFIFASNTGKKFNWIRIQFAPEVQSYQYLSL